MSEIYGVNTLLIADVRYYREAASRGAALLDACNPGWYRRVDINTLRMSHATMCVLGQLYGHYTLGFVQLDEYATARGVHDVSMVSHGFAAEIETLLRREWVALIKARRAADAVAAAIETVAATEEEVVSVAV